MACFRQLQMTKYNEAFSNNGHLEAKGQELSEGKLGILNSSNKPTIFVPDFCLKGLKWVK